MGSLFIGNRYWLVLLAGLLFPAMQAVAESTFVTEGSKAARMESCVAPTQLMRRNHMDYLKHGRDKTVRDGVRELDFSLAECIDCHAGSDETGKPIPVNAAGQFCQTCHGYVAASPDCFLCHRTTPQAAKGRYGFQQPEQFPVFQPASQQAHGESDHE